MRTYHALYKPAARKNPRRTRAAASKPARSRPTGSRRTRARSNPASSAEVAAVVAKRVESDIKKKFSGKTGLYEPEALAPAGILFIAPGENAEYGDRIYRGMPGAWKWVTFSNGATVIADGNEKDWKKAIPEATASLLTWALPMIAVTHARLQKEGKSEEQVVKAMEKFNVRNYTPDGSKLPAAGKSTKLKGPSRMTAKIYGEKPKKGQTRTGDVVWYVQIFTDDGKPVGGEGKNGGRIGPLLDGAAAYGIINSIWGLVQGEEDVIEANPVQRARLNSSARRKLARKNDGIWDLMSRPLSSVKTEEAKGNIVSDEMKNLAFDSSVGVPGDPSAAMQIGYYRGILRGMNTCKWYPDPFGALHRWTFRREMDKRLIEAYNSLAQDISEYKPAAKSVGKRVMK